MSIVRALRDVPGWLVSILDRGLGKPAQAITGGDEDDAPLKVEGVLKLVRPPDGSAG